VSDRNFRDLVAGNNQARRFLCVGLDPQMELAEDIPQLQMAHLGDMRRKLLAFVGDIVDATADVAGMYKPNLWFWLQYGPEGFEALIDICAYIHEKSPEAILTLDLKGGDIDDTNGRALKLVRDLCHADAATIHNYMGMVGMSPYLNDPTFGSFALVRTSNPGADEMQKLPVAYYEDDGSIGGTNPLFEVIAQKLWLDWNTNGNVGAVAGASPDSIGDLAAVRAAFHGAKLPILCPGVGKQGGSAGEAFKAGSDADGQNIWINLSSDITHAHRKEKYEGMHWAEAAGAHAAKVNSEILATA
jgi:orotidine 5'-phosphate decarboxylase subfamily 2